MTSSKVISFCVLVFSVCLVKVLCQDPDVDEELDGKRTAIQLKYLSQQYIPYDYEKEGDTLHSKYGIDMNAIDASACDLETGIVYTGGKYYVFNFFNSKEI